jgi:hypothetical protein
VAAGLKAVRFAVKETPEPVYKLGERVDFHSVWFVASVRLEVQTGQIESLLAADFEAKIHPLLAPYTRP